MPATTKQIVSSCILALACFATPASACSVSFMIFFDFESAEFGRPWQKVTLEQFQSVVAPGLPPKCASVTVWGMTDTAEATAPEKRTGIARAEAVRDAMVRAGYPKEAIRVEGFTGTKLLVPTEPGVREPQNRRVELGWEFGEGRWRCDPATKQENVTTCGRNYGACYLELTDGTICNIRGVPDPNPAKYSVDESDNKLK